ncbi:MAG TPA: alanine racemase [Candidatus Moranbacteria bacterium]|nr:alanine racemase [Candidatus Moranbacteria bacterium]HBT45656.1 alanine racemase [Candidatus Moranbacteria bacterium]
MLSYIEISKENLLHNFELIRGYIHPEAKVICVIKANAYGHGQNEVAQILENYADYFQVDDAQELKLLREVSKKKILVLGFVAENEIEEALRLDGILAVYDLKQVEKISEIAKKLNKNAIIHIKIDACLGRQGVLVEDAQKFAQDILKFENIEVDGIYSHFANIEDTSDFSHAQKQIDAYRKALEIFSEAGFKDVKSHISSTAGTLVYEKNELQSSLVRLGIGLYGLWPSVELKNKFEKNDFKLKPALRWVTHIAQVKTLPANYSIGYGLTYITSKEMKVAVIPQGYSDGYDRGLSNVGEVLIKGTRCKILGRVAMNMFVVDVSHLADVAVEEEVVLLGKQGEEEVTAEEIAEKTGTINYEVVARISALLQRIVL